MKKAFVFSLTGLLVTLLLSFSSYSQNRSNSAELQAIAEQASARFTVQKAEAVDFARKNNLPLTFESGTGKYAEIQFIDEFGMPQYYLTENANAAATISTNQVYTGGTAGLSLDGAGITARQWDGGAILVTHQEYGGRAVMGDAATTLNYHSTHVAGTIMAAGVVPAAKGMAPAAQIRAFDWNNDVAEMASEATSGMLVSNHSYGYIRGWYYNGTTWTWYGNPNISTQEDYLFGFYDSQAQSWDNIARNAPYYLICKSAGNERNDAYTGGAYPPDGPYDCISHAAIAKNVLTVGAVADIPAGYSSPAGVVMSSFSSWGPADDGRIKPDIVANGVSLYSTDKDAVNDYLSISGTSMSTPSVTGSLALLQQHYSNLNSGEYLRSSTLKALVIHTADEAGTATGPDYQFGWGLMNTKNAALKISEDLTANVIDEIGLNQGASFTRTYYCDGTQPFKVTVCWTDPAGTPVAAQLDPLTAMLVNDLDLRVSSGATTFYPWKLDRNNPASAATNSGENNTDNVEMVFIGSPSAGEYVVTVDHDGTLTGTAQVFSIIVSGGTEVSGGNPPVCTTPVSPLNGASGVSVNAGLSWNPVADATGYLLYFGTNNPPNNMVNGLDLGSLTSYSPVTALSYNTAYYWRVVPYNIYGPATGCAVWNFTTENSPFIQLPYTESFETGFGNWAQATSDDFDWTRWTGLTPTAKTGPKKAYNGTYYIYTEASSPRVPGDEACIEATFSFTGIANPEISLWYHMYGSQMGSLHVDVFNGVWNNSVWQISGQQQTSDKLAFRNAIVNLSAYGNQSNITIRIRGVIGSGEKSDICVDYVSVRQQGTSSPVYTAPAFSAQALSQPSLNESVTVTGYNREVRINTSGNYPANTRVDVYNLLGQPVAGRILAQKDGEAVLTVTGPGVYVVRVTDGKSVFSRKIALY